MTCKKGGLIFRRHNILAEVLMDWCKKLKPASSVRAEPHIYPPGTTVPDANLMRGDVSVFGFWEAQTEAIFDVQVVHTEAPSLLPRSPHQSPGR